MSDNDNVNKKINVKKQSNTNASMNATVRNYETFPSNLLDTMPDSFTEKTWSEWIKSYSPTLYLENRASVARDHLANERTFLAWLRSSLSFIGIGLAITQLFRLSPDLPKDEILGKSLGLIFMILGITFLFCGFFRYFHSQFAMTTGYFPASRGTVIFAFDPLLELACRTIVSVTVVFGIFKRREIVS
ncbi:14063_t:CDS:2 [Ambispora leptoticha]|uniref:14063_t:CDS:1 n=1 Tax=Ambispora leptoticha TaxID=144679 RepID=A0A9N9CU36_9GLOM|nr:14063_t:CDS:2 [Ambispora leptoticha]